MSDGRLPQFCFQKFVIHLAVLAVSATVAFLHLSDSCVNAKQPRTTKRAGLQILMALRPLQAMGAPLVGTEMRAYILSGGGLRLQVCNNWRPVCLVSGE